MKSLVLILIMCYTAIMHAKVLSALGENAPEQILEQVVGSQFRYSFEHKLGVNAVELLKDKEGLNPTRATVIITDDQGLSSKNTVVNLDVPMMSIKKIEIPNKNEIQIFYLTEKDKLSHEQLESQIQLNLTRAVQDNAISKVEMLEKVRSTDAVL